MGLMGRGSWATGTGIAALLLLVPLAGCFQHTYTVGAGAPTGRVAYSQWRHHWIGGLISPDHEMDVQEVCPWSSPELCVKVRGSSSMLRLGCLGDLLRFEKREIEVAAFAPDRSSPQSNRGDEAERTGSVGEGAGAPDPTLDLGVQALEAVRGA